MEYYKRKAEAEKYHSSWHNSYKLLNTENGCVNGCFVGISEYLLDVYSNPQIHEDQEGFVVMSGGGWALVGEQEFRLEPETAFIVPAGIQHSFKKDPDVPYVKVFWFHAAIK